MVNDNGRSYQPTIGGLASHLSSIRVSQRYEHVLDLIKTTVTRDPDRRQPAVRRAARREEGPEGLPAAAGAVRGPRASSTSARSTATTRRRPSTRCARRTSTAARSSSTSITRKGFGYPLAEQNEEDCLHQVPGTAGAGPPAARPPRPQAGPPAKRAWTDVYSDEMVAIGARRPDVVAITAAMLHPVGLAPFKAAYPDRVYDVGIAEQHAMTMAAGLAMAGLHPVVSVYATFLNRAFDQLLMDVALHKLPVTVTLDRAGVTGPDGASHNGMWDGSILQVVPGPAGGRAARRQPDRRAAQRGGRGQRRPHRGPLAQGRRRRRGRGGRQARPDGRARGARARAGPGRAAARRRPDGRHLRRGRQPARRPRHRRHRRRPALGQAGRRGGRRAPRAGTAWSRWSRTTAAPAASATRSPGCCATTTWTSRSRRSAWRRSSSTHGTRDEILETAGLTPQHLARQLTEAVARRTPGAPPAEDAGRRRRGRAGARVIDAGAAARVALRVWSRLAGSGLRARRLRVAVVGSGRPAFTPPRPWSSRPPCCPRRSTISVDVLDRLPTPYGLVRYGVAPDHKSIKSVANYLRRVLESPGVTFVGGVALRHRRDPRGPARRPTTPSCTRPARCATAASASPARTCRAATPRPTSSTGTAVIPTSTPARSPSTPSRSRSSASATSPSTWPASWPATRPSSRAPTSPSR